MKMARSVNHHNFKMTTKKGAIISKQSHFFCVADIVSWNINLERLDGSVSQKAWLSIKCYRICHNNEIKLKFWSEHTTALLVDRLSHWNSTETNKYAMSYTQLCLKYFVQTFAFNRYCACWFQCWWNKLAFIVVSVYPYRITTKKWKFSILVHCTLHSEYTHPFLWWLSLSNLLQTLTTIRWQFHSHDVFTIYLIFFHRKVHNEISFSEKFTWSSFGKAKKPIEIDKSTRKEATKKKLATFWIAKRKGI